MSRFPIAYLAGAFPLRSETFVWREVIELRRCGWTVHTFGLRPPQESTPPELTTLRDQTQYVYEIPVIRALGVGTSITRHARASSIAHRDALAPGEPMSLRERAKLVVQAHRAAAWGQRLMELGVRHIHAHFAHAPTSVAMYAAAYAGLPFSFTGHANDIFQRRQLLKKKLRRAAFVSCISHWHREFYRSVEPEGRYTLIRCGVDLDSFAPPPAQAPDGTLRVLSVARLVEKKGLDTLIQAASEMPAVRVSIAGDGPQLQQLQELAERLGLAERVRFLGPVDPSAVPRLLAEHDAFALPCRPTASGDRDGIPVALMEAMAGGLPVVAGDLPAVRELVEDGKTGRLVPGGVPEALAAVLRGWAKDPDGRADLARSGRRRVEEEFALAVNVDRLERALLEASSRKGGLTGIGQMAREPIR